MTFLFPGKLDLSRDRRLHRSQLPKGEPEARRWTDLLAAARMEGDIVIKPA
jgi:hypothetical protein